MSPLQKIDDRLFVILAGFMAAGLQVLSFKLVSPMVELASPGFTKTGAHHMLITALTLALPALLCGVKTGGFKARFEGLRTTILWGGAFSLVLVAFNIALMETASLIATGELHFPGLASPQTGAAVFMAVAVVGPIAEELLYRGFIFKVLADRNSVIGAILVTSLLALILHSVKYPRIEVTYLAVKFVQSVILCLAYLKGRLGASSLVHIINNSAAFMLY